MYENPHKWDRSHPFLFMQLTIGITDTEARYSNYPSWITAAGSHIEVIQLKAENSRGAEKCDGIVLSGGIDIHPKFYNKQCLTYPYAPEKFNEQRDEFELAVFRYARDKCLPVLAICRGMQLVNIALGGTLIQDIEASGKNDHRRHGQTDGEHAITVIKDSLLYEITGSETGHINSAQHQALGIVAQELNVNAYSPDGIADGT